MQRAVGRKRGVGGCVARQTWPLAKRFAYNRCVGCAEVLLERWVEGHRGRRVGVRQ